MQGQWLVVVITGASSGIGRAVARAFAERGAALVLVARSGRRTGWWRCRPSGRCLPTGQGHPAAATCTRRAASRGVTGGWQERSLVRGDSMDRAMRGLALGALAAAAAVAVAGLVHHRQAS